MDEPQVLGSHCKACATISVHLTWRPQILPRRQIRDYADLTVRSGTRANVPRTLWQTDPLTSAATTQTKDRATPEQYTMSEVYRTSCGLVAPSTYPAKTAQRQPGSSGMPQGRERSSGLRAPSYTSAVSAELLYEGESTTFCLSIKAAGDHRRCGRSGYATSRAASWDSVNPSRGTSRRGLHIHSPAMLHYSQKGRNLTNKPVRHRMFGYGCSS